MAPSRSLLSRSEAETRAAGAALGATLRAGDTVLLSGDLGMGKTVFARGIADALGVPPAEVRSPTFTLVNPYHGRVPVHHIDLYRIDTEDDLSELGLEEIIGAAGVTIVEWAERLGPYRPPRAVSVRLADDGGERRVIAIDDGRDA
jgi:tRNA threonylcarbamoyl adenosine modification protein YjeE